MPRILFRLVSAVLALAAGVRPAGATFPYPPPPPGTAPHAYAEYCFLPTQTPPVRPSDFAGGDEWKLTSDPTGELAIDGNPAELFGVKGMSVDLAWQVTTGRPDVTIAVLDSGIEWDNAGAMNDLRRKFRLNRRELPLPEDAGGQTKPADAQPPRTPDRYDLNDDGVLNVEDYAADARGTDTNGNGVLDPEDLIDAFSDATDADDNGYVDDIAGWDFLDDDNDAFDDVSYGHGTGEARDSTAEADNGGDLGTCPNCMVIPVRVGDSFIADSNNFAQAVVFAVDSGAHVVQEALGTVNNTSFARAAIDYAWANDVPVIASAADEESFHHNFPAANRHTIVVNSVTRYADLAGLVMTPRSYLYLNGCTNYGGNIALAISSSSCSSEATGRGSGLAGLIISAALDRVDAGALTPRRTDPTGALHPLSANEVMQILTMTADDIDQSDNRTVMWDVSAFGFTSMRHASQPGWDQYFGHGRAHARRAMDAVARGELPPEADLLEPEWWETFDPEETPTIDVRGSGGARAGTFSFELAYGCGVQPLEDDFALIMSGGSTQPWRDVRFGTWDLAAAAARCAIDLAAVPVTAPSGTASPADTPDTFTVTLRLRVTDAAARRGEARRTVYLHQDPDLLPGFPLPIGGSAEPSPLFARLRRGGRGQQLVVPTTDGTVLALREKGASLRGWPVTTDPLPLHTGSAAFRSGALPTTFRESLGDGVAAADLDRDGRIEVVAGSLAGKLYVWEPNGRRRRGFPVQTDPRYSAPEARDQYNRLQRGLTAAPVLADLDGDRKLEIIAAAMDRHVYAWKHDGTPQPGFPVQVVDRTKMASIDPESHHVVPAANSGVLQGTKIVSSPAVGPLLGDGKPVIVVGTNEEYREPSNFSAVGHNTVSLFQGLDVLARANGRLYAIPAGGNDDPAGDGNLAGPFLPGWPVRIGILAEELLPWIEGVPGAPALGDVDGDGVLEVGIAGVVGPAYVLRADGTSFYGTGPDALPRTLPSEKATFGAGTPTTDGPSVATLGSVTFAPIAPDGGVALIAPAGGLGKLIDTNAPAEQLPHDNHLNAYDARDGTFLPGFPQLMDDLQFLTNPTVGDVDGDRKPEILAGSGGYLVHAFRTPGGEAAGWPKFTGGWVIASPALGTLGRRQVAAVGTREGRLWVWRIKGKKRDWPWPRFHHDARNTGYLAP